MTAWPAQFVRTFANVLFAVLLFAVWGLLTLIGVVVDQGKDASQYFATYPQPIARAILRLGFDTIYHSPWYIGIIGLILVSLACCTFKRVIPARLPVLHPVKIDKIPLNDTVEVPGNATSVRARVEHFFKDRGWSIRNREFGGVEWSFADKHDWARRGVLVAHIGFVIIAAGTTLYWARGFSGLTTVLTGQTIEIPQTHALIRLRTFNYTIQPIATKSGIVYQPTDYVSLVTVTGNDGIPRNETIRVNHPINVDGTLYYQNNYGFAMRFTLLHNGKPVPTLSNRLLFEGDSIQVPGTQRAVEYAQFVPTADKETGQPAPDPRVTNPAVVLTLLDGGSALGSASVPLKTWVDLGNGWRIVPEQYVLMSGLQYRYDPGVLLVGLGALVLLAGLVISFYLLPARLYVTVNEQPASDGNGAASSVGIAATTVKGYEIYETQFRDLIAALKGELYGDAYAAR